MDIVATTDNGTIVNIEMQCINDGSIVDRASFYQARLRTQNLNEGEDYSDLPDIISIWITGYAATSRKACFHEIVDMYKDNGVDPIEVASEKMRQFIIELPKLKNMPKHPLSEMFNIWMNFIKNPGRLPERFLEIKEVAAAMSELRMISGNKEVWDNFTARQIEMNKWHASNRASYKRGREEGMVQVARNLLRLGVDINQISQATGLSIDDIRKLS